jgi:hypothetical protein
MCVAVLVILFTSDISLLLPLLTPYVILYPRFVRSSGAMAIRIMADHVQSYTKSIRLTAMMRVVDLSLGDNMAGVVMLIGSSSMSIQAIRWCRQVITASIRTRVPWSIFADNIRV